MGYWEIAVNAPLMGGLTYSDHELSGEDQVHLIRGQWVIVPLGSRKIEGLILGPKELTNSTFEIKSILSIKVDVPRLEEKYIEWILWLSDYYIYSPGEILASVLPPRPKKIKKISKTKKNQNAPELLTLTEPPTLTEEQQKVVTSVGVSEKFGVHLIFGVTGSGKTEIYMRLLDNVLKKGFKGLVVVPEISLTPQLLNRFKSRFGDRIATIHSHLSPVEKTNQWWGVIEGDKQILIGARSALFCPIPNLGLIIIDEEHEPSFKQEDYLKYHARDASIKLAHIMDIPILLGSATPSLESWNNALEGKYQLHRLQNRVENRAMPDVKVIDLKAQRLKRREQISVLPSWLSSELYEEMQNQLDKNKQVAIFLNRRGFANVVQCPGCGFVVECPNCDISLTLHGKSHLVCHYCDYQSFLTQICSHCKQTEFVSLGIGTEQIEEELIRLFPEKKVARADRDEITTRGDIEDLVLKMENGEIDILVGTQMIAKGLDFPNLNLVGIINADVGLNMPDFRAAERGFQIITQVSGRAGRHVKLGDIPGKVILQTYSPNHPSVVFAQIADYEGFARDELINRKELGYPPFGKIGVIRIVGPFLDKVLDVARLLMERSQELKSRYPNYENLDLLGPCEYPLARLRNQHRYQVLIKGSHSKLINTFIRQLIGDRRWVKSRVKVQADIDPMNML